MRSAAAVRAADMSQGTDSVLRKYLSAALVLGALHVSPAFASSDMDCYGGDSTNLRHDHYDVCASVPFLSPANDSRLNLQWLLIDRGRLQGRLGKPSLDAASVAPPVPFAWSDWQVFPPGTPPAPAASGTAADADSDGSDADSYAVGEGSRCRHAADGAKAFQDALGTAKDLPADEASLLTASRNAMVADCQGTSTTALWTFPDQVHTPVGRQYAAYIAGANAFYAGAFDQAEQVFDVLSDSPDPWLRETALYMIGRTELNHGMAGAFDQWGSLDRSKLDADEVKGAGESFDDYLKDYPHGRYAASARGLLRRVYWLEQDQAQLAEAYDRAFAGAETPASNVELAQLVLEVDNKLLIAADLDRIKSPSLLAAIDLMRMRPIPGSSASDDDKNTHLSLAQLQAQKDRFASEPDLYGYLLAAFHFYVDKHPQQVLELLPATSSSLDYLAFSRQTLRGFALEDSGHAEQAQQLWRQLLPLARQPLQHEQLELALAMNQERAGQVDQVFAAGSPVQNEAIRIILLEQDASPELLRRQIKAPESSPKLRDAALYTLLYKELTRARYQDFQADLALLPAQPSEALKPFAAPGDKGDEGYACPSLRDVAATLQQQPGDGRALNCLAELVRLHGVNDGQSGTPADGELGHGPSAFPGATYARMNSYLSVLTNKAAERPAKAYALYRVIHCYAPSGYNDCGGKDVPKDARKVMFQALKTEYADSPWAQKLKYYW